MKEIKKSVTELLSERNSMLAKRETINISMNEIVDKAQAEKREFSAEENVEYQKLQADFAKLGREIAMNGCGKLYECEAKRTEVEECFAS